MLGLGNSSIYEQTCFKRCVFFLKVDAKKMSHICPNCLKETGKKELSERVLLCHHSGYTTDRDGAAAQVVLKQGLAAVGHRVKMHRTASKFMGIPAKQESPHL
jgi:putative transposase